MSIKLVRVLSLSHSLFHSLVWQIQGSLSNTAAWTWTSRRGERPISEEVWGTNSLHSSARVTSQKGWARRCPVYSLDSMESMSTALKSQRLLSVALPKKWTSVYNLIKRLHCTMLVCSITEKVAPTFDTDVIFFPFQQGMPSSTKLSGWGVGTIIWIHVKMFLDNHALHLCTNLEGVAAAAIGQENSSLKVKGIH